MPTTIATVNNMADQTGFVWCGHVQYATNSGNWWAFWIDASDATKIQTAYSSDLVTWTAGASLTLVNNHDGLGRDFGVGYANISSTDVIHIVRRGTNGNSWFVRATISGTTITWSTDTNMTGTWATGKANVVGIGTDGRIWETITLGGNGQIMKSTNTDAGSSWTAGFGGPTNVIAAANSVGSLFLFALASGDMLLVGDSGTEPANGFKNLKWSKNTSGTWGAAAAIFGSDYTNPVSYDWAAAKLSNTDVHILAHQSSGSNGLDHWRWNGTSWSAGDSVQTLARQDGAGVALVSDGTSVWAFAVASASGNDIQVNKWTSGSGWSGWTALGLSSATRRYLCCAPQVQSSTICLFWTEGASTPFTMVATVFSTLVTVTSDVTSSSAIATTDTKDVTSTAAILSNTTKDVTSAAAVLRTVTSNVTSSAAVATTHVSDVTSASAVSRTATDDVSSAVAVRKAHTSDVTSVAAVTARVTQNVLTQAAISVVTPPTVYFAGVRLARLGNTSPILARTDSSPQLGR